jgi:hypothetical protein
MRIRSTEAECHLREIRGVPAGLYVRHDRCACMQGQGKEKIGGKSKELKDGAVE